jgi:activator of 2-hydroxyglutaryl-CoA dehydratase
MTGGVAKNPGARRALEEKFGIPLLVPAEPQLAGALGAALIAREKSQAHH